MWVVVSWFLYYVQVLFQLFLEGFVTFFSLVKVLYVFFSQKAERASVPICWVVWKSFVFWDALGFLDVQLWIFSLSYEILFDDFNNYCSQNRLKLRFDILH